MLGPKLGMVGGTGWLAKELTLNLGVRKYSPPYSALG